MARNPQDVFNRWKTEITSATTRQKMQSGIDDLTEAPGALAAAKKADYVAGVQSAQDKWAKNVSDVTLDEWKTDMTGKGFTNMATGASAASTQSKLVPFFTAFLPFSTAVKNWARKLPSATPEEKTAKSAIVQWILRQWNKNNPPTLAAAISAAQAQGRIPGNLPPV